MKRKNNFVALLLSLLIANLSFAQEPNVLFTADFNDGYVAEGWTAYDGNGDGVTWSINEQLNGYIYDGMTTKSDANDWLFTPSFEVKGGKSYILSFTIAQRGAYGVDNIVVSYGQSATPQDMQHVIAEEVYNMVGGMSARRYRVYVEEDASCVLGINLTAAAGNGIVSLKSISLRRVRKSEPN